MLDTLQTLCTLPGVSGDEGVVRDYILSRIRPHVHSLTVDALGNVLAQKRGANHTENGKTILLTAHMDEVGFIVTDVTDEGYLKFAAVGGMDRRVIVGKRLLVGENQLPGVVGIRAHHLVKASDSAAPPPVNEMYIDIGAADRAAAEQLVNLGDTAVFDSLPFLMGGCIAARALDNRVGCAVLLELLTRPLPIDVQIAFTAQEEIGARGAAVAAYQLKPDIALVLEATTAADLPTVAETKQACKLGGGVVVPFMDRGTVYDRALYQRITQLAERHQVPWQTKRVIAGGTDASAIQRSRAGVQVAGLAIAARNVHTGYPVGNLRDMEYMLALTRAMLDDLAEGLA